jgi:subtilisin family serine protease
VSGIHKLLAALLALLALALVTPPPQPLGPPPGQRGGRAALGFFTVQLYGERPVAPSEVYQSGYTGAGVRVAVVDSGADYLHPDLAGAVECLVSLTVLSRGRPLVWCAGVNGTLQQAYEYEQTVYSLTGRYPWLDEHGHGTHVAGIIAGSGAASGGRYRGVAPGARLWVVKVFDARGEAGTSAIVAALRFLASAPVDVVNLSFGSGEDDPALRAAVEQLAAAGKVVVAAAGNAGQYPYSVTYPARYDRVVAVAAVLRDGRPAPFSSVGGPGVEKPDAAALGVAVVAPLPRYTVTIEAARLNEYYGVLSGTSMACAVASGLLALWVEAVGRAAVAEPGFARLHSAPANPFPVRTYSAGWGLLLPP